MLWQASWKDSLVKAVQQTTDAVAFARAWLQWEPHEGQQRWLLAPSRDTAVLVTGRRWGKSEVAALRRFTLLPSDRNAPGYRLGDSRPGALSFDVALMMCQRQRCSLLL